MATECRARRSGLTTGHPAFDWADVLARPRRSPQVRWHSKGALRSSPRIRSLFRNALANPRSRMTAATMLDVQVYKKSLPRALRVMDTLIKALALRGYPVRMAGEGKTLVEASGTQVQISMRELYERIELPPTADTRRMAEKYKWYEARPRYDRRPTGRLALQILDWEPTCARKTWRDGKKQRVETCLNAFIVGIVAVAESKKALERSREEQRRRWAEQQRLAEEQRCEEEAERTRIADLRQVAEVWKEARLIREYLDAYRAARQQETDSEALVGDKWLAWAEEFVDRLDPLGRVIAK